MSQAVIPLHIIRRFIWNGVQTTIERNNIPSVTKYIIGTDANPLQIEVSLTGGDYFEPSSLIVDIQIHNYPCTVNSVSGTISAIFSMPYAEIEDCSIDHRVVHVDHISDEFWDTVGLEEIARFVSERWNAGH